MTTVEKDVNETAKILAKLTARLEQTEREGKQNGAVIATLDTDLRRVEESVVSNRIIANNLQDRVVKFDEEDRKKTLLINGMPESNRENLRRYCDVLFRDLQLPYGNEKVDTIYRLGKFDDQATKPRSIVIKLSNKGIKGEIYRNISYLQGNQTWAGVSLQDELSKQETKEFNELRSLYFLAKRNKVENVRLRQRALVIDRKTFTHKDIPSLPYGLNLKDATTITTPDGICFKSEHNPLSNLFPCKILHKNGEYSSVEQALQYDKALSGENKNIAESILKTHNPYEIMELGKGVTPRKDWNKGATKLVYELLQGKFSDDKMADILAKTGEVHLYECTFHPVYGVGRHLGNAHSLTFEKIKGGNMLGRLLEKVRSEVTQRLKLLAEQLKKTHDDTASTNPPEDQPKQDQNKTEEGEKTDDDQVKTDEHDDRSSTDSNDDRKGESDDEQQDVEKDEDNSVPKKVHTPILDEVERAQLLKELIALDKKAKTQPEVETETETVAQTPAN